MLKFLVFSAVVLSGACASASLEADVENVRIESVRQNKTRLPEMIQEGRKICTYLRDKPSEYETCMKQLLALATSQLGCESSLSRWTEMGIKDQKDMNSILADHPLVPVNDTVSKIFEELIEVGNAQWVQAKLDSSLPVALFPLPQWNIRAYNANFYNAHAGADGSVLISNKFWSEQTAFTESEIRAILGHEVAHVLLNHSLQTACVYNEWAANTPDLSLQEAQEIIRADFSVQYGGGKAWSELSQRNEFQADLKSVELLDSLEYNAGAMSSAIRKLHEMSPKGGFTSGTHPELLVRADKAQAKAQELANKRLGF
ncbi:MAG: M48 family metalloprotease [Bdellovibrionales bacterium]|nr:M48 family metalloprotease [Bdellovibrionales bacterium]